MDLPAGIDASDSWLEFPQAFFMSRIPETEVPKVFRDQPLRAGWEKAVLDKKWDGKAGQRSHKADLRVEPTAAPDAIPPRR
jgi:hypothetical protein